VLYDAETKIETLHSSVLRVVSAAQLSSWEWQWTLDSVTVDWDNYFINTLHHEKKWLESVVTVPDVDESYDDQGYSRGIQAIPNVQGRYLLNIEMKLYVVNVKAGQGSVSFQYKNTRSDK